MSDVPTSLDRFEILRILGKGGMGTVYLARDARLGRQVALKVLNSEELGSSEARARFLREARSAASIRHQNVATIYEVGETAGGDPFLVMEYCEGETLAQRIRRRPISVAEFLSVARQIAAGVAAAHATGVVHRDIKSANIIIESSGAVKILDFGLAKHVHGGLGPAGEAPSFASTSSGHFFGTLHYLAPEQARGGGADERSDLFSVGVVLYQMACGRLPFDADAPLLVLEQIRFAEPAPFQPLEPGFPQGAAAIISRLLQKEPQARYQQGAELLRDLEAIDVPAERTAGHPTRTSFGRTVPRRRRMRLALTAIAFAVLAGAAVYMQQQTTYGPVRGETTAGPIRSMAVLPLNNLADNPADEFLSVSLADALVTKLQQIPSIQVRPTSAVLSFQGKNVDARTASSMLQVDGVLEGNYLAAGELVRVSLQLTDSRSGYSVWAATIDGKRDDLLQLIDEVSARTIEGLNDRLGVRHQATRASEPRSAEPAAYEQYLRARALSGTFVPELFEQQVSALEGAIALDPNFAAAHAELAIALSLGHTRSLTDDPRTLKKAEWAARQAVRLDPNLPQAHLALGRVFVRYADRYPDSAREILAALRLNPSDTHALHSVVTYFVSAGDLPKAECIGRRIVQLDPQSNEARTRGYWYVNSADPEGALANARWALASPDSAVAGHDIRAVALILLGKLSEAEREADALSHLVPGHYLSKSLRAMIAAARGDRQQAEAMVAAFEDDASRNHWAAIRVALVYSRLDETEKAMQWITRATELGHHNWYALVKHPWLEPLQADPRFQAVVSRIRSDLDDVRDDMVGLYNTMCGG